jgi:hypothetical protein
VFPSGKPIDEVSTIEMADPTWELEHKYFFQQILGGIKTNLSTDRWISGVLKELEPLK